MRAPARHPMPGVAAAGWTHPYPLAPWSPLYADGGDGGTGGTGDGGTGTGGDGDTSKAGKGDGDGDADKGSSEAEKWKAQARKHEQRAKDNAAAAKELEDLKAANATDTEKAIGEAVKKAVADERSRGAAALARQVFIAGATGRIDNAADVVEDVNLAKYIDANGDVDQDGLAKLIDRLAPKGSGTGGGDGAQGDGGQGDGGGQRRHTRAGGGYQGARQQGGDGAPTLAAGADLWAERHKKTTT